MADPSDHKSTSITQIDPAGDLYLEIDEGLERSRHRFLVTSRKLRNVSVYFQNLLDPSKFREGAHVQAKLDKLRSHENGRISDKDLPVLQIGDVPNPSSSTVHDVLQCFLEIVHETSSESKAQKMSSRKVPMNFITRLAIIADRFLAVESIKPFVDAYHKIQQPSKETFRLVYSLQNEQYWRQRLLVGIWFGYPNWVFGYSRLLIQHGSEYWSRVEAGEDEPEPGALIWTHIPWGIEGKR
ncbi:MAG: hypothetical protein MMC23_007634 [Stictis urceolatum]|nr:hypothetical protein [Stictis urceolata]